MSANAPPTYSEAVTRDPWPLIVTHLHRRDVATLARVCKGMNGVCNAYLWADATKLFSLDDRESFYAIIGSLFTFYTKLYNGTRPATAALVKTLQVSPVCEQSHGMNRLMLGRILQRLPNLRALIVSRTSSFDHGLTTTAPFPISSSLRVLVARRCKNATTASLNVLVQNLPELQYLDLSYTRAAAALAVVASIANNCPQLQVLKLRGTALGMPSVNAVLVSACLRRYLRSLDLRDNGLKMEGFSERLDFPVHHLNHKQDAGLEIDYENVLLNALTRRRMPPAAIDLDGDGPEGTPGLTHLYLSGNTLSPVSSCIEFFARIDLRVADLSQPDGYAIWAVMENLARHSGHSLLYLRADIGNFPTSLNTVPAVSNSADATREEPPEYDQAVRGLASEVPIEPASIMQKFTALHTLVLTDIGAVSAQSTVDRIKALVRYCAVLENELSKSSQHAKPRMRKIVLEILPETAADRPGGEMISATEDWDNEAMWSTAATDFSFFGDEKPTSPTSPTSPVSRSDVRQRSNSARAFSGISPVFDAPAAVLVPVLPELSRWRTECRNAHIRSKFHGLTVTGAAAEHWSGQLQVVNKPIGLKAAREAARDPWDHLAGLEDMYD